MATELIDFRRGAWQTFSIDHDEDDAASRFQQRYGQPPQHIAEDRRWKIPTLKAGPVPHQEVTL